MHPNIKKRHIIKDQVKVTKHDHGAPTDDREIWSPQDGLERSLYSFASNILEIFCTSNIGLLML